MRKAAFACGSMVLYIFSYSFSPGQAKKNTQKPKAALRMIEDEGRRPAVIRLPSFVLGQKSGSNSW
jgi:hypothetical protein